MQRAVAREGGELQSKPLTDFCSASTAKSFCSVWCSFKFAESKDETPNAEVTQVPPLHANDCPGLFGI